MFGILIENSISISRTIQLSLLNTAGFSSSNGASLAYLLGGTNTSGTATYAGPLINTATTSTTVDALDKRLRLTAAAGGTVAFAGVIPRNGNYGFGGTDGNTSIYKEGAGTVVLSAAKSYDGPTEVCNGTLVVGGSVPVGTGTGVTSNGTDSPLGNDPSAIVLGSQSVPQLRSGPGISLAAAGVALTQPADNLALLVSGAFTIARAVTVNNFGASVTLGGSTAAASAFSGTLTLNRSTNLQAVGGGTVTVSGLVQDGGTPGSVAKVGAGTVELTAANNTYTGGTTVSAGTLLANGQTGSNSGTGPGPVGVAGGTFGGSGRAAGLVSVNAGGTLAPGTPTAVGTFTAAGGASVATGGSFRVALTGAIVTAAADSDGSGTAGTSNSCWWAAPPPASASPRGRSWWWTSRASRSSPTPRTASRWARAWPRTRWPAPRRSAS